MLHRMAYCGDVDAMLLSKEKMLLSLINRSSRTGLRTRFCRSVTCLSLIYLMKVGREMGGKWYMKCF